MNSVQLKWSLNLNRKSLACIVPKGDSIGFSGIEAIEPEQHHQQQQQHPIPPLHHQQHHHHQHHLQQQLHPQHQPKVVEKELYTLEVLFPYVSKIDILNTFMKSDKNFLRAVQLLLKKPKKVSENKSEDDMIILNQQAYSLQQRYLAAAVAASAAGFGQNFLENSGPPDLHVAPILRHIEVPVYPRYPMGSIYFPDKEPN